MQFVKGSDGEGRKTMSWILASFFIPIFKCLAAPLNQYFLLVSAFLEIQPHPCNGIESPVAVSTPSGIIKSPDHDLTYLDQRCLWVFTPPVVDDNYIIVINITKLNLAQEWWSDCYESKLQYYYTAFLYFNGK